MDELAGTRYPSSTDSTVGLKLTSLARAGVAFVTVKSTSTFLDGVDHIGNAGEFHVFNGYVEARGQLSPKIVSHPVGLIGGWYP